MLSAQTCHASEFAFNLAVGEELRLAAACLDELATADLKPARQAQKGPVRCEIDEAVQDLLGLSNESTSAIETNRRLCCAGPSVHTWHRSALDLMNA